MVQRKTLMPPFPRRARRKGHGKSLAAMDGRAISMRWPACCSAMRGFLRFSKASTMASRSARRAISMCRWRCGISITTRAGRNCRSSELSAYKAIGVVGQIIPWNFPLLMLAWKVAPALAAGNTVVLKPAEFTPLTALLFAELAHKAGLPPGVLNVVTGEGATGAALVEHAGVDKIAFTGSTEVGRLIRKATAGTGKSLTLELGGKSPFIVFDDADLDGAVEGVVDAIWFNQGQVCCAGSRLLVQEGVAAEFIKRLKRRMGKLRVGHPLDKAIDMGAIIDPIQLKRIGMLVDKGVAEGAEKFQPEITLPATGLLLSANSAHQCGNFFDGGDRGNLRARAGEHDLPHPR